MYQRGEHYRVRYYFSRDTNFAIEEPVHIRGFIFCGKAPCHAHFIHINHNHYFSRILIFVDGSESAKIISLEK